MRRIVVASNRGPVTFALDGTARRGGGGLASSLAPLMAGGDDTWVAAAMSDGDRAVAARAPDRAIMAETDLGQFRLRLVSVAPDDYSAFYDTIANRLLWFALHRLFDPVRSPILDRADHHAWDRYVEVNRAFASTCAAETAEGDYLLVQDYHLPLVPGFVRHMGRHPRVAHFSHTPWPRLSDLGLLPDHWIRTIVAGMLGADVLGFHSARWAANFVEAAVEVGGASQTEGGLEYEGRPIGLHVFALGPDAAALASTAGSPAAQEAGAALDEVIDGRQVVLRVERLEPAKNTLRGLLAFERMLDDEPALRSRVVHIALVYPSRLDVPEYLAYRDDVEALVSRIGARHPGSLHLLTDDNYPRSLAALERYDCLVVNSIADGLNLVAKEGAILNRREGALVISRDTGAIDHLGDDVMVVNPYDTTATAATMATALTMPAADRTRRATSAREAALATSPRTWLRDHLNALDT